MFQHLSSRSVREQIVGFTKIFATTKLITIEVTTITRSTVVNLSENFREIDEKLRLIKTESVITCIYLSIFILQRSFCHIFSMSWTKAMVGRHGSNLVNDEIFSVEKAVKPVARTTTEGYNYVTPKVTLPVRPPTPATTTTTTTTELQLLYGAPRNGRGRRLSNR